MTNLPEAVKLMHYLGLRLYGYPLLHQTYLCCTVVLAGGLTSSARGVQAPRLQQFNGTWQQHARTCAAYSSLGSPYRAPKGVAPARSAS
jgi:hypothetical protein